jgi:exosortase H (IPTLxxWG-CTERM-specific)
MKKLRLKKPVLKAMVRLYLVFGVVLALFIIAYNIKFVRVHILSPFTAVVTYCASLVMNLFGAGSSVGGSASHTLSTAEYSLNIVDGCNGIDATAILVSGVIAYPSRLKDKMWGVLFGFAAIFVFNLGRVISLFYLGQYYPDVFEGFHVYVWQVLIIVWAIFVWDFWSRKIQKKPEAAAKAA